MFKTYKKIYEICMCDTDCTNLLKMKMLLPIHLNMLKLETILLRHFMKDHV